MGFLEILSLGSNFHPLFHQFVVLIRVERTARRSCIQRLLALFANGAAVEDVNSRSILDIRRSFE